MNIEVKPFVSILSAGGFQAEADCNLDGFVDFFGYQRIYRDLKRYLVDPLVVIDCGPVVF